MKKYSKEVEIDLTADDLAEIFISWGDDYQGAFINLIAEHFKKADFDAEMQCCYIASMINKDGKDFIYTLANFLKVEKFDYKSKKFDRLINTYPGESLR